MRPQASGGSQKGGDQAWRRKRSTPLRWRRGGRDPRICAPGNLKKLVKAVLWAKSSKDLLCDSHKARVRNISAPFQKPGKISSLPLLERSEKPAREQTFVCFD